MPKKEDWPPKGYLDHGELAREDYPELYAAIAKAYAKPQKKFKLPRPSGPQGQETEGAVVSTPATGKQIADAMLAWLRLLDGKDPKTGK